MSQVGFMVSEKNQNPSGAGISEVIVPAKVADSQVLTC